MSGNEIRRDFTPIYKEDVPVRASQTPWDDKVTHKVASRYIRHESSELESKRAKLCQVKSLQSLI